MNYLWDKDFTEFPLEYFLTHRLTNVCFRISNCSKASMGTRTTDGTTAHWRPIETNWNLDTCWTCQRLCVCRCVCACVCVLIWVRWFVKLLFKLPVDDLRHLSLSLSSSLLVNSAHHQSKQATTPLPPPPPSHSATPTSPPACWSSSYSCFWEGLCEETAVWSLCWWLVVSAVKIRPSK